MRRGQVPRGTGRQNDAGTMAVRSRASPSCVKRHWQHEEYAGKGRVDSRGKRPASERRAAAVPVGRGFIGAGDAEDGRFVEGLADDLQADGQLIDKPGRYGDAGEARDVHGQGEYVVQVHLVRVACLFADLEGGGGGNGRDDDVALLERGVELAAYDGTDFLGLEVVGIVVAGGERVGADHDAALDLGAEAEAAGLLHVLPHRGALLIGEAVL